MSIQKSPPKARTIKLDSLYSVQFELAGDKVVVSLLAMGVKTFSRTVSGDLSLEVGNAGQMFGLAAKEAGHA